MSVNVEIEAIHLQGRCGAEDAEELLLALRETPDRVVDLSGVSRMHMAVVQILLVLRPTVRGVPENGFLARHLANLLQ